MAGGTSEAESRPSVASPMAFLKSTCSCFELVARGVWGCLVYHLGFGEDCADDRSKKDEHEEEEEDGIKTGKREVHEDQEGDETKPRKKEEREEEVGQTETRSSEEPEEEDETKTRANGGSTENFGVMLTRGPKRPGIDVGGGGQVN